MADQVRKRRINAAGIFGILALLALTLTGRPGHAAPDDAAEVKAAANTFGADLSRVLQRQARAALERHLRPEEFQVFVTVVPSDVKPEPMPYLPETLMPVVDSDATPESLAPLLKRVEVEVLIADRYNQAAKTKLDLILSKTLALDPGRGDKVSFSSLGLKLDRPETDVERDLARSEAEARELKTRLDSLGRERDDAKRDLSQTKSELDRVARDKPAAGKGGKEQENGGAEPPNQANQANQPGDKGFWRENAGVFVASLLVFAALFLVSFGLRAAAKTLGVAVQSIGAGLPILGEKLSESLAQKPQALLPPSQSGGRGQGSGDDKALVPVAAGAALPMEAVARRVLELHEELLAALGSGTEGVVLEHLSHLLDDAPSVGRAVATMELLGKEKANELYARLADDHQQKVAQFLRSGTHVKPKGEVMLEAGELLKTKLFGASFTPRAELSPQVAEKLLLLRHEGLVEVAAKLGGEALARFFLYLEPTRLGTVLTGLKEKDAAKFIQALLLVAKIPEVETATNLDGDVAEAVEDQIVRASSDIQSPYLAYYKALVESVDDDVAETLSEQLAAASPRVERFVRESIVTFGTFFKLHGDIQEEIATGLSNKDLAAVVSTIREDLKQIIYGHIETRRRDLVEEEVDRLAAKGLRQVTAAHRAAKRQVVARILQIKGEAPLSGLLAEKSEGASAATDQARPTAA